MDKKQAQPDQRRGKEPNGRQHPVADPNTLQYEMNWQRGESPQQKDIRHRGEEVPNNK